VRSGAARILAARRIAYPNEHARQLDAVDAHVQRYVVSCHGFDAGSHGIEIGLRPSWIAAVTARMSFEERRRHISLLTRTMYQPLFTGL
jgi:hypothetical protein